MPNLNGNYIAVVQNEDCKGRNALAPPQREAVGRAYKEKARVGQLVYNRHLNNPIEWN